MIDNSMKIKLTHWALLTAMLATIIGLGAGCEHKNPPVASHSPPPRTAAPSLGDLQLPEVQIPTQDQLDAATASEISEANADKAFEDLQKEIDEDTGG